MELNIIQPALLDWELYWNPASGLALPDILSMSLPNYEETLNKTRRNKSKLFNQTNIPAIQFHNFLFPFFLRPLWSQHWFRHLHATPFPFGNQISLRGRGGETFMSRQYSRRRCWCWRWEWRRDSPILKQYHPLKLNIDKTGGDFNCSFTKIKNYLRYIK